jgi:hypothetical protein
MDLDAMSVVDPAMPKASKRNTCAPALPPSHQGVTCDLSTPNPTELSFRALQAGEKSSDFSGFPTFVDHGTTVSA